MKIYVAFTAILTVVIAAPQQGIPSKDAQVVKYKSDYIGVDGYKFAYETSDGVSRSEVAEVKNLGSDHEAITVRGQVSWTDVEGKKYTLNFVADEIGFHPEGKYLPH